MKKKLNYLFAILAMLFFCRAQGQNFVRVEKSNSGQSVQVAQDQVVEVKLPQRPSTGYTWVESSASKTIQRSIIQIGDAKWVSDPNPLVNGKHMVGQSGTQIIRYVGTKQGTTVLTFELKRPWENNPPMDYFTITVVSGGQYTGSYAAPVERKPNHQTFTPNGIPTRYDWRSKCPPIENQGSCGDCWAYATVGCFEANMKIIDNVTKDLSEEFVTDCYTNGCNGCNGGFCAMDCWLASYTTANKQGGGAVYESDNATTCNNTGKTGTCGTSGYPHHETIDSHSPVSGANSNNIPPDANIKAAIYNYGPVWMAFDASSSAFNSYKSGILTESGTSVDHAVVFVGYVDSASVPGGGYWIVRNSWGSSWGQSGYFYLSYGSDACGTDAEYLVYKGGVPHAVAPLADFSASTTSSCSSAPIQFTDASTNSPTSWLWNFGDGTTSTLQNPTHAYTANGTYVVSLNATNQYGNNTATKNGYITINLAQAPVGTNGSGAPGSTVKLSASGSGTLNWYDAATGGNLVGTGTTFTTPALSATTTYYVESDIMQAAKAAGMAANTTNGAYYTSTTAMGLVFDVSNDAVINTVDVYAGAAVTVNIWIKNSGGTVVNTVSKSLVQGKQTVTLNFSVPAGTGYTLGSDGGCNLWRETAGATFPYTVANLVSITGNTVPDAVHYYYFYNWQVAPPACSSLRVPVKAIIAATGINEYSETDNLNIYPVPASSSFDITPRNINFQNASLTLVNILGEKILERKIADNNPIHIDASSFPQGIYLVELKTDESTYVRKITIVR